MKFRSFLSLILLCALACVTQRAYAQAVSSAELIDNSAEHDGTAVLYEGEVIGELMRRGGYAWANVHDGNGAIGVWLPLELSRDIEYTGSYKAKGDVVAITGIFHRNCPEHGGDTDIHAQQIRKIKSGRAVSEQLNVGKRNQAIILGVLCLSVWILTLLRRR